VAPRCPEGNEEGFLALRELAEREQKPVKQLVSHTLSSRSSALAECAENVPDAIAFSRRDEPMPRVFISYSAKDNKLARRNSFLSRS